MIGDDNNQSWKDGEIIGRSLETKVTPINESDVRNSNFEFLTVVNQSLWWRRWANSGEILVVQNISFHLFYIVKEVIISEYIGIWKKT